jgi:phytanoyl-CoA hydroxylase
MVLINTREGLLETRNTVSDDYAPTQLSEQRDYFDEHGFVVIRGLLGNDICDKVVQAYLATETSPKLHIGLQTYRYSTDTNQSSFTHLLFALSEGVLRETASSILDQRVEWELDSNYIAASRGAEHHRDGDFLQGMIPAASVWVALEDMTGDIANLFIRPDSQLLDLPSVNYYFTAFAKDETYEGRIAVASARYDIVVPKFRKGDAVVLNSWTVHGSTTIENPQKSRHSLVSFNVLPK